MAAGSTPIPSPTPAADDVCGGVHSDLLASLNRPSIGFSACAAKPREAIAELGYSESAGSGGNVAMYPQGFLRFGSARNFELDVIASGRFDSGLGAKYEFWHDGTHAFASDFLYT